MNSLKNLRVLVTGGCGFIGKNLTEELIKSGAVVTVLDLPSADWTHVPKKVSRITANILEPKDLKGALKYIDVVYHLAARTDLDGKTLDDYEVNFKGTKNLILEATKNSAIKKFVFYSTQLVVGLFNQTRFIDESEPYRTKTPYGQSKIEGEKNVIKYCDKANFAYTIIRPTSVYGPWGDAPYKDFFKTVKNKKYFHIGKADNLISLVYVKNLVDLTLQVTINDKANNEIYFGNDFHPYTMREFVDAIADYYKITVATVPSALMTLVAYGLGVFKFIGINVPIYPFRLRNIKSNYCYDVQKSLSIGYNPKYDLNSGIKETLDWYENNNEF